MKLYSADQLFVAGKLQAGGQLLVSAEGRVLPLAQARADTPREHFAGCVLVPGTVNAHSHCFQVLLRGVADHPRDFRAWVDEQLYPCVERLDVAAFKASARLCFLEMLRAGVTSVGEFHYVHNGPAGAEAGLEYDRAVIEAAREVGLRLAFLRTFYDQVRRPGQRRFCETPQQAVERSRALQQAFAGDAGVRFLTAPHSLHGASAEMIQAAAAQAADFGSGFHIHLAEQKGDVAFAQELYGTSPLRALQKLGVLDARTTLVHGIWLDAEERSLLAEAGGALVSNPSTNMMLGDGIAGLQQFLESGIPVALGTDANYNASIFEEMRLAESLQRVSQRRMGILSATRRLPKLSAESAATPPKPAAEALFALGTRNGARALHLQTGSLAAGEWADFICLDLGDASLFPGAAHGGEALLSQMISAMVVQRALRHVFVGGEAVLRAGQPLRVDAGEVVARARAAWGVGT